MSAERNVCLVTSMPFSRICVKALFNAPVSTHCDMVPQLADCLPIQMQTMNRMARLIYACVKCSNSIMKMLSITPRPSS